MDLQKKIIIGVCVSVIAITVISLLATYLPRKDCSEQDENNKIIHSNNTLICISAQTEWELNITYPVKDGQSNKILQLPFNESTIGEWSCFNTSENITFNFKKNHSLTFNISHEKDKYFVNGIKLTVNASVLTNFTVDNTTFITYKYDDRIKTPLRIDNHSKTHDVQMKALGGVNSRATINRALIEVYKLYPGEDSKNDTTQKPTISSESAPASGAATSIAVATTTYLCIFFTHQI